MFEKIRFLILPYYFSLSLTPSIFLYPSLSLLFPLAPLNFPPYLPLPLSSFLLFLSQFSLNPQLYYEFIFSGSSRCCACNIKILPGLNFAFCSCSSFSFILNMLPSCTWCTQFYYRDDCNHQSVIYNILIDII